MLLAQHSGLSPSVLVFHKVAPRLTCEGDVAEDQQAAAAEADGVAGGGEPRQDEETGGQFTHAPGRGCLQHALHDFGKTCTHKLSLVFKAVKLWNFKR